MAKDNKIPGVICTKIEDGIYIVEKDVPWVSKGVIWVAGSKRVLSGEYDEFEQNYIQFLLNNNFLKYEGPYEKKSVAELRELSKDISNGLAEYSDVVDKLAEDEIGEVTSMLYKSLEDLQEKGE